MSGFLLPPFELCHSPKILKFRAGGSRVHTWGSERRAKCQKLLRRPLVLLPVRGGKPLRPERNFRRIKRRQFRGPAARRQKELFLLNDRFGQARIGKCGARIYIGGDWASKDKFVHGSVKPVAIIDHDADAGLVGVRNTCEKSTVPASDPPKGVPRGKQQIGGQARCRRGQNPRVAACHRKSEITGVIAHPDV